MFSVWNLLTICRYSKMSLTFELIRYSWGGRVLLNALIVLNFSKKLNADCLRKIVSLLPVSIKAVFICNSHHPFLIIQIQHHFLISVTTVSLNFSNSKIAQLNFRRIHLFPDKMRWVCIFSNHWNNFTICFL